MCSRTGSGSRTGGSGICASKCWAGFHPWQARLELAMLILTSPTSTNRWLPEKKNDHEVTLAVATH